MIEGPLILAKLIQAFEIKAIADNTPQPVAYLTVRAKDGIHVRVKRRDGS